MKSVIRSIKPYWYYLICEGIKTLEIGKNEPKSSEWNRDVYCYMSKDKKSFNMIPDEFKEKYRQHMGKVGMKFTCNGYCFIPRIMENTYCVGDDILQMACLNRRQLWDYGKGITLSGWHISNLKIYDKPRELREFYRHDTTYDNCLGWAIDENGDKTFVIIDDSEGKCTITRPPQSWQYIEEDCK